MVVQRKVTARSRRRSVGSGPVYAMGLASVRPVIRIAHQVQHPMRLEPRIIFDHEFVLFLSGRGEIRINDRTLPFGPHELWLFRPFVTHAIRSDPNESVTHIAVHFDFAPNVPPMNNAERQRQPYRVRLPAGVLPQTHCVLHGDHAIVGAFGQLLRAWSRSGVGSDVGRLEASAVLMQIIAMLARMGGGDEEPGEDAVNRKRVERAIAYAREHLQERLDLEALAEAAGLSTSHTARLFHHFTGYAPMQFIRQARVERARQLLGEVDLSIKQIAARTGFASPYLFSRVFRRIDGLSPSEYRQALLAGQK